MRLFVFKFCRYEMGSAKEIKAELLKLGVDFSDCVEKAELEERLRTARDKKPESEEEHIVCDVCSGEEGLPQP